MHTVLDGAARQPMGSLPLFLRHDPRARKGEAQFEPVTTETGRNIVEGHVNEALGGAVAESVAGEDPRYTTHPRRSSSKKPGRRRNRPGR